MHINVKRILFFTFVSVFAVICILRLTPEKKSFWEIEMQKKGAKTAWEEFKKTQVNLSPTVQHANAHEFGSLIYKAYGIKGITACDDSFNYGCFHSVIGEAIIDKGLAVLKEANSYCLSFGGWNTITCQHGIGHGVMGASQYTFDDLLSGLKICSSLDKNRHIFGCMNGIFMEYSFKTFHSGKSYVRPFDEKNPLFPCDKLPSDYRKACYFFQPQWWAETSNLKPQEMYRFIGKLCSSLPIDEKAQCALGAGVIAPRYSEWQTRIILANCKELNDHTMEIYCRAALENFPGRKIHSIYCDNLNPKDTALCKSFRFQ